MRSVLLLTLVAGCYKPGLSDSMFTCSMAEPACPSGFECRAGQCIPEGSAPTITITEPTDGDGLDAAMPFTLAVSIHGLDINPNFPDSPVEGQGHWHWFVDDIYQAGIGTTSIDDAGPLEAGCHVLKVDLRQNDHEALDPPVSDQISVYSSDGGPTICITSPPGGETVDPGEVSVEVDIRNFVLDMTSADGHGHWHVWVDDAMMDSHLVSAAATVTIPNASGDHRIKAELVKNDESGLSPPRSATVTVTVP